MKFFDSGTCIILRKFRLRDDEDVDLICDWHIHLVVIPLLELYALLVDEGNNWDADTQSRGEARRNIRRQKTSFFVQEEEDEFEEATEEEEEQGVNYFTATQPTYAQPAVNQPYDHPKHFSSLNLGAMNQGFYWIQGGHDDDPIDEFEVGKQFEDKEVVVLAMKTYSIRRVMEYKILESD
ncbi:hypothetical protein PIB30_016325 [Stylosanthes scabra]|uniref:Uncharacterized protein n=1 Tax=Stylosanthes scabra TaxID=79078 RepID=A0ABU6R7K6_9FABA|nr:hypothetical protein [Stylosanthes scabra]